MAESGQHFDLVADEAVRAGVARMAGLRDLPRFEANFDVTRHGVGGLHVTGRVSATVGQNCVLSLEPIANEIEEEVDLRFMPAAADAQRAGETEGEDEFPNPKRNDPEPLIGGIVDLGALATEFLILGINPYPRSAGAVFEAPEEEKPQAGPFAALAGLTKGSDGR